MADGLADQRVSRVQVTTDVADGLIDFGFVVSKPRAYWSVVAAAVVPKDSGSVLSVMRLAGLPCRPLSSNEQRRHDFQIVWHGCCVWDL
eukprot:8311623-Pyramimonas_sp.AAC.1